MKITRTMAALVATAGGGFRGPSGIGHGGRGHGGFGGHEFGPGRSDDDASEAPDASDDPDASEDATVQESALLTT